MQIHSICITQYEFHFIEIYIVRRSFMASLIKRGFQWLAGGIDCQVGVRMEWIRVFVLHWNWLSVIHAAYYIY